VPETSTAYAVLGPEVAVTGEIRSREPLTIEGDVEGTIDVSGHRLTVAVSGNVRASVKAKEIDVHGSLQGNVEGADIIYIRAGARFLGDIQAHGIVIEDGGFIRGNVDLSRPSAVARAV
jgi:cytoskeletal protein CcmA (bactofilin family)